MTDITLKNEDHSFILAEIGLNHNRDVSLACKMIDDAVKSGADGVKFQTYITDNLMNKDNPAYSIFRDLELSAEDFAVIAAHCRDVGTNFVSTPFCRTTADWLAKLDVNAFKIASSDITYLDFIGYVASLGKPIILSTGMSDYRETDNAVEACLRSNNANITILHCISKYPPEPSDMCLRAVAVLKSRYPAYRIGLSDHTGDQTAAVYARALGAAFFEKHFTSDKNLSGPDQAMSADPAAFRVYCDAIHAADQMGQILTADSRADLGIAPFARRSLFASQDIAAGQTFSKENLTAKRPGDGISAAKLADVIGHSAARHIQAGEKLLAEDVL